jgi:hypothetical protein
VDPDGHRLVMLGVDRAATHRLGPPGYATGSPQ